MSQQHTQKTTIKINPSNLYNLSNNTNKSGGLFSNSEKKTDGIFSNSIPTAEYQQFRTLIPTKKFIAIDGLIGAGKTTLIRLITDYYRTKGLNVHPIYEPVEMWQETGALDLFYSDIPAKCYEFQSFVYVTRVKKVIQEVLAHPDADIFLLERTVFTDRYIFVEMLRELMGPTRMAMYAEWWDMWSCINPIHVSKWVLLDVSLDESLRRIKARSRNEETGISTEYQTNLHAKHHEFYTRLQETLGQKSTTASVLVIPPALMDLDYITNSEPLQQIAELIISGLAESTANSETENN
jgi:deoxyadenosine/deoxycytidine kinase